jgi:flagellar basal-body rod protein FlgB
MVNKLDELLNFHSQALGLRAMRQQILASNIANADTPGYKARDIDFRQALKAAIDAPSAQPGAPATAAAEPQILYRTVVQPSADGNTVDMDVERAQFAENAARYEANLTFLNGRIRSMLAAIQG